MTQQRPCSALQKELPVAPSHHSLTLFDTHFVAGDKRPSYHDSTVSLVPAEPIDTYRYSLDAPTSAIHVLHTVNGVVSYPQVDESVFSVIDILLVPQWMAEEPQHFEIKIELDYHELPPPRIRRHTGANGIDSWDLGVCFTLGCVPREVGWAEWSGCEADATIVEETIEPLEPSPLDPTNRHSRYSAVTIERTNLPPNKVVGIFWKW